MKFTVFRLPRAAFRLWASVLVSLAFAPALLAYPPALPHTFYGMIRDEFGNPLPPGATITLEALSGVKVYGMVSDLLDPGVNYRLRVPLDAGLTLDTYKPTALNPAAPFKIKVTVGTTVFLPIEMTHNFLEMGQPGKSTLLNLTLGVDENGDGLPDAWQRRINSDLSKVGPDADSDGDGLSNLQEYLAGTYAYDPQSGFTLNIVRFNNNAPVLAFTAISGRTYTVVGAADLDSAAWTPVQFHLAAAGANAALVNSYSASSVTTVEVEVATPAGGTVPRFFRLMLK